MTKFQCMVSGTVINVEHEHDVKVMLTHPQYTLYVEPVVVKKEVKSIIKD
jgi:hypothetical protein